MISGAPLTYPLAGLLAEPAGETRTFEVHGAAVALPDDLQLSEPIDGTVRLARTNRGVLVKARLNASIEGSCSRCLRDIEIPISIEIDEEALPSVDLATGQPLDRSAEPDVARLTAHNELELGRLVGEAISLAKPIAPLCEASCPGLCPTCGERLGPGHPAHEDETVDPRLDALRSFRVISSRYVRDTGPGRGPRRDRG